MEARFTAGTRPGSACESRRGRRRRGRRSEGKESDRGCYFLFCHGTQLPKENSSNAEATLERGRQAWFTPRGPSSDSRPRVTRRSGPARPQDRSASSEDTAEGNTGPRAPASAKGRGPQRGARPASAQRSRSPRAVHSASCFSPRHGLILILSEHLNCRTFPFF